MAVTMGASLSDISSNARVKGYASLTVLQVANAAIFRQPGYEPRKRPFDVPPKGEAEDPERSQASSRARARAAVRDIALCNHFAYFFTWTLNKELVDRYDAAQVGKKVRTFLKTSASARTSPMSWCRSCTRTVPSIFTAFATWEVFPWSKPMTPTPESL